MVQYKIIKRKEDFESIVSPLQFGILNVTCKDRDYSYIFNPIPSFKEDSLFVNSDFENNFDNVLKFPAIFRIETGYEKLVDNFLAKITLCSLKTEQEDALSWFQKEKKQLEESLLNVTKDFNIINRILNSDGK